MCNKEKEQKPPIPFPDEIDHLEWVHQKIDAALEKSNTAVERFDEAYMELKRYMVENRGDIDPHEMFQNELALKRIDGTGAFEVLVRDKLVKLKDSPYFSRIDFKEKGAKKAEKYYIGRFAFGEASKLLIIDWRAPAASMFYDDEIGPAGFEAPQGRIQGDLIRKRQFKIKDGKLVYAFETGLNIQDEMLQRELGHTSDDKMKSMIATIQKEQNQIIRNEHNETLLIQGVAGSGRTSIALHRIAFLLYRFKDQLAAHNVAILSPNQVFADYISNVLPELGEEPIEELSFEGLASDQLKGIIDFEKDPDPMETSDEAWASRVQFKSTLDFAMAMNRFIDHMSQRVFAPVDYVYGHFTVSAVWIRARFESYAQYPVKRRLQMTADDIISRLETDNFMADNLPKRGAVLKALNKMLTVKNTLALYKAFYKAIGRPEFFVPAGRKKLEWSDVFPFIYLHAAYAGIEEDRAVRHLIVDEMQDYTPIQYAVLNRIFKCPKTILGDFGQFVNPNHMHTLSDLQQLYGHAAYVELLKSYRSTYEIISFAKGIKPEGKIQAVKRHGASPDLVSCRDYESMYARMRKQFDDFTHSPYTSLGVIVKTHKAAKDLYDQFDEGYGVQLISPESTQFKGGILITSIQMAKGLEFDSVVIPFADRDTYFTEYDRNLLYVAATRAMHQLTLLYVGECSPLIQLEIS